MPQYREGRDGRLNDSPDEPAEPAALVCTIEDLPVREEHGIIIGWCELNIAALLEKAGDVLTSFSSIMITSIDSTTDVWTSATLHRMRECEPAINRLGMAAVVSGERLANLSDRFNLLNGFGLFCGFDELWCFNSMPQLAKPETISIVCPCELGKGATPRHLISWMRESNCALGLGDGYGLNYATCDRTLAIRLESIAAGSATTSNSDAQTSESRSAPAILLHGLRIDLRKVSFMKTLVDRAGLSPRAAHDLLTDLLDNVPQRIELQDLDTARSLAHDLEELGAIVSVNAPCD